MPTGRWMPRLLAGRGGRVCARGKGCAPAMPAKSPHVRLGQAPHTPRNAVVMGALPDTTKINAVIELKPSDPLALSNYARGVSSPGSPEYDQYLTVGQLRQKFGPTQKTLDAVRNELRAQGLNPGQASANGLLIPVTASAG